MTSPFATKLRVLDVEVVDGERRRGTRSTDSTRSNPPSAPNITIPGRTEAAGMNASDLLPRRATDRIEAGIAIRTRRTVSTARPKSLKHD